MNTKPETWTHACPSTGNFVVLRLDEVCPRCLINHAIHSLRHDGFLVNAPRPSTTLIQQSKVKIAALFAPKKTKKTQIDEDEQNQYLHRIG